MRVLVSACLVGRNCKYNGGNNYNAKVVEFLRGKETVEICPEMLAGLGVPRPCAEIRHGVVVDETGRSLHEEFERGVCAAMETAKGQNIDLAVLQSRSPTCGVHEIYDGSFTGKLKKGSGLFVKRLREAGFWVVDASDIGSLL